MSKTVVEIQRTWGRYVKGDIAGFEPAQAKRLIDAKPAIAKPYKGEVRKTAAAPDGSAELAKRMADLDEREKQLAAREAELEKAASAAKPAASAGQPPKQGGK